ncbi:MAG: hypothetical protein KA821_03965 [Chitinophagaceae bacterium]|nr:hypothetical protein [Chitinophagaceae bacterium]
MQSYWRFNKVGQGCFYTGTIKVDEQHVFNFIYDCGTLSERQFIRGEIRCLKLLQLGSEYKLDVLTLSHLDADHVNMCKELLDSGVHCKRAILPYLSLVERLMVFLKQPQIAYTNDYISFCEDPVTYLKGLGVQEIILIQGSEEPLAADNPLEERPEEEGQNDGGLYSDDFVSISQNQLNPEQTLLSQVSGVRICRDMGRIKVDSEWEFFYYNKRMARFNIESFKAFLEKELSVEIDSAGLDDSQIRGLFRLPADKLTAIKKEFKKKFKNLNSTGLTVLHGPVRGEWEYGRTRRRIGFYRHEVRCRGQLGKGLGKTLLNGDINLSDINYPKEIQENLQNTIVFQVPHHGAKRNWNAAPISNLYRSQMVINFGWGNRFGHPGLPVIADIKNRWGWKKRMNTQKKSFSYLIDRIDFS